MLVLCAAFPSGDNFVRAAGSRTLGPYVLHFLPKILLMDLWMKKDHNDWEPRHFWPLFCAYRGCILLFYLPWVHEGTKLLVTPPLSQLYFFRRKR